MTTKQARGVITAGQKRFLKELVKDGRGAHKLVIDGIADGAMDDMSATDAAALIGKLQAARKPRPALRKGAAS